MSGVSNGGEVPATPSELLDRASREPLGVDISDYSDEWCAGFLAGQTNALEFLDRERECADCNVNASVGQGPCAVHSKSLLGLYP